jgi:hypothetical protein
MIEPEENKNKLSSPLGPQLGRTSVNRVFCCTYHIITTFVPNNIFSLKSSKMASALYATNLGPNEKPRLDAMNFSLISNGSNKLKILVTVSR